MGKLELEPVGTKLANALLYKEHLVLKKSHKTQEYDVTKATEYNARSTEH